MNRSIKLVILSLSLVALLPISASAARKEFDREAYKTQAATAVAEVVVPVAGTTSVRIAEVKRLENQMRDPAYCRAWISVRTNNRTIKSLYYDDINGLGGPCGIYRSNSALPADYLAVIKLGDYDGRLLLVRADGQTWDLPGGSYFVSPDRRYLYSVHECDSKCGLAVFDLKEGKSLFELEGDGDKSIPMAQWYTDGRSFFFTSEPSQARPASIFTFDLKSNTLSARKFDSLAIKRARKVVFAFDAQSEEVDRAAVLSAGTPAKN